MKLGKYVSNALLLIVATVCLGGAPLSAAAAYPDHPIKLIVGFTAGGPASTISVMVAKRVSEFLEQPMIVEHKPGGSATLGATYVAKSKPDGYTLFTASDSPLLTAPLITPDLTYTLDDFVPIVGYGISPCMIDVKMGRWNSLNDLIADAKKNPGKFSYSTQGVNSFTHMFVRIFFEQAGIDLKMIPYPGTAEAIAALLGGHVDVAFVGGTGGLYEAGRLDILAVSEKARLSNFPKVPTLNEIGYPLVFNAAYFLSAPKGTPKEVTDKLTAAHQKAFAKYGDEIGATLKKFEMYPAFLSAKELVDQNNYRRDLFRKAAKSMGIYVPNR